MGKTIKMIYLLQMQIQVVFIILISMKNRSGLRLQGPLKDKVIEDFSELIDAIFAKGFGRITDLKIGPDGYIYVLSSEDDGATLYKITKL